MQRANKINCWIWICSRFDLNIYSMAFKVIQKSKVKKKKTIESLRVRNDDNKGSRLVSKSVTLNDLERRNDRRSALSPQ